MPLVWPKRSTHRPYRPLADLAALQGIGLEYDCRIFQAIRHRVAGGVCSMSALLRIAVAAAIVAIAMPSFATEPSPDGAKVYIIWPRDGHCHQGRQVLAAHGPDQHGRRAGRRGEGRHRPSSSDHRYRSAAAGRADPERRAIICISARARRRRASSLRRARILCSSCSAMRTTRRTIRRCYVRKDHRRWCA